MRVRLRGPRGSGVGVVSDAADISFKALGTTVRVVVEDPEAESLALRARRIVEDYDQRLSRFRPDSELCALNADPQERVPASQLLRTAVRAALNAAERSGGLVDPTLLTQLEQAGYRESMEPRATPLFPAATPTRPARPNPEAPWRAISVEPGAVVRPPGLRLDLGGTGKGHVADIVAGLLGHTRRWAVDCGGDVRVGGVVEQEVVIAHPLGGEAGRLTVRRCAVATSAVHTRAWDGGHHLIDPSTGSPAFTGVIAATATANTTIEAETKAKTALLGGPDLANALAVLWFDASAKAVRP